MLGLLWRILLFSALLIGGVYLLGVVVVGIFAFSLLWAKVVCFILWSGLIVAAAIILTIIFWI